MSLPRNISILVSMLNMRLRDDDMSLETIIETSDENVEEIMAYLSENGYVYDQDQKQIKLKTGNLPARTAVSTEMTRYVGNLSGTKWGNIVVNAGEFALSSVYDLNTVGENIQYETPISILQPYVVTYMWKRVS